MIPDWTEKMDAAEKCIIAAQAAERKEARGDFKPKKGVLRVSHEHGFIVMDLEAFGKLPKSQQTKILKLGGN